MSGNLGAEGGSPAIRASGISKVIAGRKVVRNLTLDIAYGQAVGLIGPNGAGKTSSIRVLSGVSRPSSGELSLLGEDASRGAARRVRMQIGIVPQADTLDRELTVEQNVYIFGRYYGLDRRSAQIRQRELLELAGLSDRAKSRIDELSGGLRRRVTISRALVNAPQILFLDEPSAGLDPSAREAVWSHLAKLKESGTTLVMSTHHLQEAVRLCDQVLLMDEGTVIERGRPDDLVRSHCPPVVVEVVGESAPEAEVLGMATSAVRFVKAIPGRTLLYCDDGEVVADALFAERDRPPVVLIRPSTLEDVFFLLTGSSLIR